MAEQIVLVNIVNTGLQSEHDPQRRCTVAVYFCQEASHENIIYNTERNSLVISFFITLPMLEMRADMFKSSLDFSFRVARSCR